MAKQRQLPFDDFLYNPSETQTCTDAFYRFISEYDKIIGLFFFTVRLASQIDEMRNMAAAALSKAGETVPEKKTLVSDRVRTFSTQLSRNLVTNMADNLLCYISEILQDVVRKRSEVLRSSERLTTEDVLQFTRMDDLIAFLADKKISDLSYGGLRQMKDFIADRLGIDLFDDEKERMLLTILVELRNIHTHNRGRVNELFVNRVGAIEYGNFKFKIGEGHHVDFDEFGVLSRNAITIALRLDQTLATKFKIKRALYKNRLAKERAKNNQQTKLQPSS